MPADLPAPLAEFRFIHWLTVRFRDLDTFNHVNNSVYATYLESARIDFYQRITGMPLEQLNIILAELTISYKAPAFFNDRLGIGVRVASFGNTSFSLQYCIAREPDGALIANARSVLVMYDYAQGRAVPVPEEFKRRAAEL